MDVKLVSRLPTLVGAHFKSHSVLCEDKVSYCFERVEHGSSSDLIILLCILDTRFDIITQSSLGFQAELR